jgi:hypothetical protein
VVSWFSRSHSRHSQRSTDFTPVAGRPEAGIGERFRQAWATGDEPTATAELLPARLARAALTVLPVSGVGLSLINQSFRVPLGASDAHATAAERLQFTQGEGPCLEAAASGRMVAVEAEEIERRWPMFARALLGTTPFVAVLSLPLPISDDVHCVVDLFLAKSLSIGFVSVADATVVSDQIVHALQVAAAITRPGARTSLDAPEPDWLRTPAAQDRRNVWIAMGMLMTRVQLTAEDALASLRAYAYSHDMVLDDLATDLVHGTVDIDQVASV